MARLWLLLLLAPIAEIAVLVWIAQETSILVMIGLLVGAGVLGSALARYQGLASLQRISTDLNQGRMPSDSLFDGLLVLLAALLLIIPGLLSDLVAISLLLPPTRKGIKALLRSRLQTRFVHTRTAGFAGAGFGQGHDRIIDVKVLDSAPRPEN